jgi:hypothetical protein
MIFGQSPVASEFEAACEIIRFGIGGEFEERQNGNGECGPGSRR